MLLQLWTVPLSDGTSGVIACVVAQRCVRTQGCGYLFSRFIVKVWSASLSMLVR